MAGDPLLERGAKRLERALRRSLQGEQGEQEERERG
jgi:hypothetical protein